ncbi:hypothetical protein EGI31_01010 [Lacihabitans soyangensis]|uniref:Uncharacterized protein n=1 Tax=Lacihabitans soyangensis TaxID=869394 RepID=A0AAE3KRI8_9BACT|nr:hypothetical protein [Lacihabitans soyangensis]
MLMEYKLHKTSKNILETQFKPRLWWGFLFPKILPILDFLSNRKKSNAPKRAMLKENAGL